jgi:hypothetical protein
MERPVWVPQGAVGVNPSIRNPLVMRSREQVGQFLDGFGMVEPGLMSPLLWRPACPAAHEDPYAFSGFAGAGRTA